MKRPFLFSLLLLFLPPGPAGAREPVADTAAIDAIVHKALACWHVPGCAVAIVKGDRVWLKGYGVKELGKTDRVTPDTLFGIGSCTKAVTATAIALLVDDGKMKWDDLVSKHVPDFRLADPLANRDVTLRDLLCHRSGLARHEYLWYRAPWSLEETVRRISDVEPAHSFRSRYEYNNIAYITLGLAIGSASGMPWHVYVQKRLFTPLGMTGVVFTRSAALKRPDHASPHALVEGDKVTVIPWYDDDRQVRASGSIKAGVRDLSVWVRFQLAEGEWEGKQLVSRKALLETRRPQIVTPIPPPLEDEAETTQSSYGLGWHIDDYRRRHLLVQHGGAVDGFRARITLVPKEKLGIVVLANLDVNEMPAALSATLVDRMLDLEEKDWNGIYKALHEKAAAAEEKRIVTWRRTRQSRTKPSRELEAYAGAYKHPGYGTVKVTREGGALQLSWSSWQLKLTHFHYDTFATPPSGRLGNQAVTFTLGADGTPSRLRFLGQEFRRSKQSAE
jgi:CubicO group peptidase (beta-lactamase class C family)